MIFKQRHEKGLADVWVESFQVDPMQGPGLEVPGVWEGQLPSQGAGGSRGATGPVNEYEKYSVFVPSSWPGTELLKPLEFPNE